MSQNTRNARIALHLVFEGTRVLIYEHEKFTFRETRQSQIHQSTIEREILSSEELKWYALMTQSSWVSRVKCFKFNWGSVFLWNDSFRHSMFPLWFEKSRHLFPLRHETLAALAPYRVSLLIISINAIIPFMSFNARSEISVTDSENVIKSDDHCHMWASEEVKLIMAPMGINWESIDLLSCVKLRLTLKCFMFASERFISLIKILAETFVELLESMNCRERSLKCHNNISF